MTPENETCQLLTAYRAELDKRGIPSMRGNGIHEQTTKLYLLSMYAGGASTIIMDLGYQVDLQPLTDELHVITASSL